MAVRQINLIKLVNEIVEHTNDFLPGIMLDMANIMIDKAAKLWSIKAKNASPWGERYASTIKVDFAKKDGEAKVYADEGHSNYFYVDMVENGVKSWSIKKALLAGKAARRNLAEHGTLFVRVPFRHRAPGKTKATSSFSSVLSSDIYEEVKRGGTIPSNVSNVDTGKLMHYAGLKRFGGKGHSQYLTFRTVSEKSKGWQHPGSPATPVFDKVVVKVEKMIAGAIIKMAQGFGKDLKKKFK